MKAILVDENKNLVWSDVADPVIKDDEVLVKIHAAALNRADLLQRQGKYPSPAGCPEWMGLEIAGVIAEVGNSVTNWKIGDRVCALLGGGGYAEYVTVRYDMLMPIPENCSMVEAAAIPEAFATAYLNLFIEGKIQKGNTLLMHAGASGLASVVIPMAKAFGVRVITTVISDEKAASIAHLGADLVVNTKKENIADVLKAELEALKTQPNAKGAMAVQVASAATEERVDITVPRGYANDEPNLLIAVNGVNYLLPRGKTSNVPKFIAEEFYRSQAAQKALDDRKDEMLGASK